MARYACWKAADQFRPLTRRRDWALHSRILDVSFVLVLLKSLLTIDPLGICIHKQHPPLTVVISVFITALLTGERDENEEYGVLRGQLLVKPSHV